MKRYSTDRSLPQDGAENEEEETSGCSVECVGFCTAKPNLAVMAVIDGTILVYDINAKVYISNHSICY